MGVSLGQLSCDVTPRGALQHRAVIRGCNPHHSLWVSMLDKPMILWVKLTVVDRIHPKSNRFVAGLKNKASGDSQLNNRSVLFELGPICKRVTLL